MKALGHLKTITEHKLLVMNYCFRVGLIRQGLLHDLSKYSWTEFRIGAKYYSGTRSPNASEREEIGYSTAWLHHKGRNKHHLEYWLDYNWPDFELVGQPMPTKYMVELCLKNERMDALFVPELQKIMESGEKDGGELIETLRTYLRCGRSKSQTARELYVHLNTVKYRLTQIREKMGLDLDNDDNALRLMLSFKMLEYSDIFRDYQPMNR